MAHLVEQDRVFPDLGRKHALGQPGDEHDIEGEPPRRIDRSNEHPAVAARGRRLADFHQPGREDAHDLVQLHRAQRPHRREVGQGGEHVAGPPKRARGERRQRGQPALPAALRGESGQLRQQRQRILPEGGEIGAPRVDPREARVFGVLRLQRGALELEFRAETIEPPLPAIQAADDGRVHEQPLPAPRHALLVLASVRHLADRDVLRKAKRRVVFGPAAEKGQKGPPRRVRTPDAAREPGADSRPIERFLQVWPIVFGLPEEDRAPIEGRSVLGERGEPPGDLHGLPALAGSGEHRDRIVRGGCGRRRAEQVRVKASDRPRGGPVGRPICPGRSGRARARFLQRPQRALIPLGHGRKQLTAPPDERRDEPSLQFRPDPGVQDQETVVHDPPPGVWIAERRQRGLEHAGPVRQPRRPPFRLDRFEKGREVRVDGGEPGRRDPRHPEGPHGSSHGAHEAGRVRHRRQAAELPPLEPRQRPRDDGVAGHGISDRPAAGSEPRERDVTGQESKRGAAPTHRGPGRPGPAQEQFVRSGQRLADDRHARPGGLLSEPFPRGGEARGGGWGDDEAGGRSGHDPNLSPQPQRAINGPRTGSCLTPPRAADDPQTMTLPHRFISA